MNLTLNQILALYDLEDVDTELIRHYDNLFYKIKTERTYALRICSPKTTRKQLKDEINWLVALRQDTTLLVPQPVVNRQGNFIIQVEDRYCVLFEWIEGEPVSRMMSSEVAKKTGYMMAQLHLHASSYVKNRLENEIDYETAESFDRDYFFGADSWWRTKAKERLPDDYQSLIPAIEKAQCLIDSLGKSSEQSGMIHCDLHFGNIISNGEDYAIIDFGDCRMGHYLLDLAVTEAEFKDYSNADELISIFGESYYNKRGCLPNNEDIKTFEVISSLLLLEWIFESNSEKVREDKTMWLGQIIKTIRESV